MAAAPEVRLAFAHAKQITQRRLDFVGYFGGIRRRIHLGLGRLIGSLGDFRTFFQR
jgi:hypothetical protein